MIYGVGIDLVRIERIKTVTEKWGRKFLERVYTEDEIAYCYGKKFPYLSLAVRFAAKEALIKASGGDAPFTLRDIEVVNYGNGKPDIRVGGGLKKFFSEKNINRAHLSLSHEKDYGVACVLLET